MTSDLRTINYCFSAVGTLDLFLSVFMAMDALPCQLDTALADLAVTTEIGAGQLSQGWR
jgi:hypothetical protein